MCRFKCVWWMVLEWNVFEDVVCDRDLDLYVFQSASGRPLPACVLGGMALCMQNA